MSGYLELFIGPMFSGKTSMLIKLYQNFVSNNNSVKAINFVDDNRYTRDDFISSHDKEIIPCIKCKILNSIYPIIQDEDKNNSYAVKLEETDFHSVDVFLINEGQFYCDIVEWIKIAVGPKYNKKIYVCGLDGDFKTNVFGDWLNIIPLCDRITKLNSICYNCKERNAIFSHRLSNEKELIVIGSNNYIPLCRKCYNDCSDK
jgi:thymidine kinase